MGAPSSSFWTPWLLVSRPTRLILGKYGERSPASSPTARTWVAVAGGYVTFEVADLNRLAVLPLLAGRQFDFVTCFQAVG